MRHATITKTQNAQPLGVYQPTAIDERKKAADFLVQYAYAGHWTLHPQHGNTLCENNYKTQYSTGIYLVTTRQLRSLEKFFNIETDF